MRVLDVRVVLCDSKKRIHCLFVGMQLKSLNSTNGILVSGGCVTNDDSKSHVRIYFIVSVIAYSAGKGIYTGAFDYTSTFFTRFLFDVQ